MSIFMLVLFLCYFSTAKASKLIPTKKSAFLSIKQAKQKPVIQAILFDFNLCQTCLIGLPKLIKESDTNVLIAISGISESNRNKLAKKWSIHPNRITFISRTFRKSLPKGTIYFELSLLYIDNDMNVANILMLRYLHG